MNSKMFDRAALKVEGRAEGRVEGRAEGVAEGHAVGLMEGRAEERIAERAREAALLEAMSERGCNLEDAAAAFTNGDIDELYREYGIE